MYAWVTNHGKHGGAAKAWMHRSFYLHGLPRSVLWCRIFGHRPVVDGYGPVRPGLHAARWVCCDRCGVRPDPQGNLDESVWSLGQRYDGPFVEPSGQLDRATVERVAELICTGERKPGPWPKKPTGDVSAELVVGRTFRAFSVELKIGNAGSENKVAAHLQIWPFGALYLSFGSFGTWLQRRLNPVGYDSRGIELSAGEWRISWKLWAKRNEWSRDDPKWMQGSISLDLIEHIYGPKRYNYENVGEPQQITVRMPHGDDHEATVQLQRQTLGRRRGRKRYAWVVDWTAEGGIPTRPGEDRGGVWSSAVEVPDAAVEDGGWPMVAAACIASALTADRVRRGYRVAT
ncbi:hypothetical protein Aph01nite_43650 [Acrocarpospora phusangensis]|uniref:Uncharacterized protein n=1 Tax=Acrocarpospora phusangensis TaxID=1070424 RepID=A0A919QES5_9ACTN|nr:hypothetical protein [Acrocarpospora phusangensis]GIH26055.1 hypothetical protein Aph01nite_43650 [Acrocarpospora phusangensis]